MVARCVAHVCVDRYELYRYAALVNNATSRLHDVGTRLHGDARERAVVRQTFQGF